MDTSLKPAAAGVSVSGKIYPLLANLKDAVKAFEAGTTRDPAKVSAVLDSIATAIEGDSELKARPALKDLVTPSSDTTKLPAIPKVHSMALSAKQRMDYVKGVIDILTQEVNAPEGGRRSGRRRTLKRRSTRRLLRLLSRRARPVRKMRS